MESPFRDATDDDTRLIETMLWTPEGGIRMRDRHLARLARSAARLGFPVSDPTFLLNAFGAEGPRRLRLTMDRHGALDLVSGPYQPLLTGTVWTLQISAVKLNSADPWLSVKSTRRALYDMTRAALPDGVNEVIFLNECNEFCEGAITNLFADFGQGLVTPPLCCGLLPGILREEMLEIGHAREQMISIDELRQAKALYVGNSLRGLIAARLT